MKRHSEGNGAVCDCPPCRGSHGYKITTLDNVFWDRDRMQCTNDYTASLGHNFSDLDRLNAEALIKIVLQLLRIIFSRAWI